MRRSWACALCCLLSLAPTFGATAKKRTTATRPSAPARPFEPLGPPVPVEIPVPYAPLGPPVPTEAPEDSEELFADEVVYGPPAPGLGPHVDPRFQILPPLDGHIASAYGKLRGKRTAKTPMRHHEGVDMSSPSGTPIHAAATGMVVRAAYSPTFGRHVVIQHENGYTTLYAHMSKMLVTTGQSVEAGSVIGKVGRTGRATGPHLHFEVKRENASIDPEPLLVAAIERMQPSPGGDTEELPEKGVAATVAEQ